MQISQQHCPDFTTVEMPLLITVHWLVTLLISVDRFVSGARGALRLSIVELEALSLFM